MEKLIIDLMEVASDMPLKILKKELELAESGQGTLPYLRREVIMNEMKRRKGKRHLDIEKVKKYYESRNAAL